MKITLNLATRPYADQGPALKRLRIGMAALVVVLAALGLGLMHFHKRALAMAFEEDSIHQKIARIQQEEQGYEAQMQQPANAKVLTQAQFLNRLFDEKSFSWTAAMEDLERVLPTGVQVTAIEPSRGKDGRLTLRLRISGQRERAVETVRNMERSQRFVSPRISGENSESNSGQGDLESVRDSGKVTFEVLAEYSPATLEERRAEIAAQKRAHSTAIPQQLPHLNGPRPPYVPPAAQPGRAGVQRVPSTGGLPTGQSPFGPMGNGPMGSYPTRGRETRPMNLPSPLNPMNQPNQRVQPNSGEPQ